VTYLPVDLNTERLDSALSRSGQDPLQRTLFLAEGLTMYLTPIAVDEMLACVAQRGGAGSSIVFDYVYRSILEGDSALYGAAEAIRLVRRRGEPFLFGIAEGEIGKFLAERGFECVGDLPPAELERIYLSREDGSLIGRAVGYWALAHARQAQTGT
jgi:methyltransferase (TIGR00027 family)